MATRRTLPPTFEDELNAILNEVNKERIGKPISFRVAILEGLKMPDGTATKIREGKYRPTMQKLQRLAKFLGVPIERFPTYGFRVAQEVIDKDVRWRTIFQKLGPLSTAEYNEVTDRVVDAVTRDREAARR